MGMESAGARVRGGGAAGVLMPADLDGARAAWWMVGGGGVFLLTLMSPLAALAQGYLFSAHMLQHILLVLVVPALALMALPASARAAPADCARLLNPAVCWACGVGAMWVWHAPALCNAAASSRAVSAVQTHLAAGAGRGASGGSCWRLPRRQRIAPLHGVVYLFAACMACTVLGIILTFSPVTVCSAYLHPVDRLGIASLIEGTWGL